jgi:hypothetical protein
VSDNLSFVLHAPADEAYASALAGAIGAVPLKLDAQAAPALRFGPGVICIVVWSEALLPQSEHVLQALSSSIVLVARRSGVLPRSWDAYDVIDASAATADAEALAGLSLGLSAAEFDRSAQLQGVASRRQPLALRSAYGMAATLAVASFITPWIMERAQATDAADAGLQPSPAQGAVLLRASLSAMAADDVEEAAPSPTPALDQWLGAEENEFAAAAFVVTTQAEPRLVAMTVDAEPLMLTDAVASPLEVSLFGEIADHKAEAFAYEAGASTKPSVDRFDHAGSAKHEL